MILCIASFVPWCYVKAWVLWKTRGSLAIQPALMMRSPWFWRTVEGSHTLHVYTQSCSTTLAWDGSQEQWGWRNHSPKPAGNLGKLSSPLHSLHTTTEGDNTRGLAMSCSHAIPKCACVTLCPSNLQSLGELAWLRKSRCWMSPSLSLPTCWQQIHRAGWQRLHLHFQGWDDHTSKERTHVFWI